MTTIQKPTRRRWKPFALAALVVFVCVGLAYLAVRPTNGIWVGQLEAELNRDLPDGSTEEEARAWCISRGFFTSGLRPNPNDTVSQSQFAGGVMALVPNETLLEDGQIQIFIYFDRQGRVCKRDIRRWVRSL